MFFLSRGKFSGQKILNPVAGISTVHIGVTMHPLSIAWINVANLKLIVHTITKLLARVWTYLTRTQNVYLIHVLLLLLNTCLAVLFTVLTNLPGITASMLLACYQQECL